MSHNKNQQLVVNNFSSKGTWLTSGAPVELDIINPMKNWMSEAVTGCVLPETCNFIKKETLAEVFSCEFCEISKNTSFTEHL